MKLGILYKNFLQLFFHYYSFKQYRRKEYILYSSVYDSHQKIKVQFATCNKLKVVFNQDMKIK